MRLLSINPRGSLGARLENLLSTRFALQTLPEHRNSSRELFPALQQCLARLPPNCVWRAYQAPQGVLCAIARLPKGGSGGSDGELEVYFLDANAWVYSAALWAHDAAHGWWLNSVLQPSYDCEHGWWLGALLAPQAQPGADAAAASQEFLSLERPAPRDWPMQRAR